MQLKMEGTTKTPVKTPVKTPKGNKKTPKKVNAKETPLKKEEVSKTPKAVNTPKSNKKSPKPNANGTVGTPKQGNQQKQKTPQKGDKTPQNKGKTPNTPEGSSSKRRQKQNKVNKKQKLDDGKSREIKTDSSSNQNEKDFSEDSTIVKLAFPNNMAIPVEDLLTVLLGCESAEFTRTISIKCNPNTVSQKIQQLKELRIEGESINVVQHSRAICLTKKTLKLRKKTDQEKAQKFFNAESIENLNNFKGNPTEIYLLTFATEEEAVAASEKKLYFGKHYVNLRPYYGKIEENQTEEGKKVKKQNQKSEAKQAKNVQKKQEQKKRKVEEEEEESDDDEEEEDDGEFELSGEGIDMDDDDDDSDEDDDDDDEDDDEDDE